MAGQHIAAADAPAAATLPPDTVSADTQLTESEKETEKNTHVGAVADGPRTEEAQAPEAAEPEKAATSPAAPPAAEKLSRGKIVVIMAALGMAVFLAALDSTIVTTALPTIAAHFQVTEADYTWVASAYLLAAAAATPTWGKVSDIFGRKPVLLLANAVFFVGSAICGWSTNIKMLIAGRTIQGIGGGGLLTLVNICISDLFSMRNRGIYFAVIGGVWAIASAVGPVLGGVFTDLATWRWAFWINMPCDGIAFVILLIFLDIETPRTPIIAGLKAIDYLGSLAIVGGTIMFLYGLELGGVSRPWSSIEVICLLVFGLATIALFFLIEGKAARYPLIPLRLFARRSNLASLAVCFVHSFVFIAGAYFLPLYFQAVLGVSPLLSGVYLFPFVLTLSLGSAGTGIFIRKTGQYLLPIRLGLFLMTLGAGLFADLPPTASWPRLILFQLIAGLGAGPNFQAPLIALQSLVPPADIASATATFGFVRQLSSALSIVIGGVIFQNGMHVRTPDLLAAGIAPAVAAQLGAGSAGANTAVVAALPGPQHAAATSAYTLSLQLMWVFYLCVAVFGGLASAAIGRNVLSKTHHVTKTGLAVQEADRRERLAETRRKKTAAKEEAEGEGGGKEPV